MIGLVLKKLEVTFYGNGACLVRLSEPEYGSLDAKKLAAIRGLLLDLASLRLVSSLILEVSRVQFFGAGFAGVLVDVWDRLRQRSRRLAVCGLTPHCARLVQTLRLQQLFDIYPTEIAVLGALDRQSHEGPKKLTCPGARVHIRDVDWDPNMVCVSYIGEDEVPVRSEVHPRQRLSLMAALADWKPCSEKGR